MKKRTLATMISIAMAASLFTGCGGDKEENAGKNSKPTENKNEENKEENKEEVTQATPKELIWNLGTDPKYLDPGLNSASDGGDVCNNTFEGLVREFDGEYKPGIAEKWEISDDGLTYKFYLRESKWSDGKPLTAHDFEYAWKRVLNPDTKSEYNFIMFPILNAEEYNTGKATIDDVGVKALDDLTLEVKLKAPTPYFIGLTQFYSYFPVREDVVEGSEDGVWAKDPNKAIGNGPFKLTSFKSGDRVVFEKNENYWNAENVKLDKITALMIVEQSTSFTAYKNGDIHVIDDVPSEEIANLMAGDPEFRLIPQVGTYYYIFNMEEPSVQDIRVRRALTLALDKKSIVENVTKGGQIAATGFVPPGILDAEGNEFKTVAGEYGLSQTANIEEAKKLLAEAGYPDGKGFPELELKYNTSEGHKKIAEAVQDMWKTNLGINVKLTNAEWAVFQTQRSEGDFQVCRGGWIGDYSDPNTMLDLFVIGGAHNDPRWNNQEYTNLVKEASMITGQERMNKFYEAEKILMEDLPIIPIYYYTDAYMVKANVSGLTKTKLNTMWFGDADIAK